MAVSPFIPRLSKRQRRHLWSLALIVGMIIFVKNVVPVRHYPSVRKQIATSPPVPRNVPWALDRPLKTEDDYTVQYMKVGQPMQILKLKKETIVNERGTVGGVFNPAILRMPPGAEWEFMVVARGPTRNHPEMWVDVADHMAVEHNLIAFGANMTTTGFLPVSKAIFLPIKTNIAEACGGWAWPFGAEDPRLQWSDDGRPMLTYVRPSTIPDVCRDIALAEDLRTLWPDLMQQLDEKENVAKFDHDKAKNKEVTFPGRGTTEKGWMPFFPGAIRNRFQRFPNFSFKLVPRTILKHDPQSTGYYAPGEEKVHHYKALDNPDSTNCVHTFHPHTHADGIHHATPLYRFTMCPRNKCIPNEDNTVLVAMNHLNRRRGEDIRYGRFFSLWNVTEPHEYIAVGPEIDFNGMKGYHFAYGMSLTFLPKYPAQDKASAVYGLSHGFIDDDVIVSLGIDDHKMGTVKMAAKDILIHMFLCDPPAEGETF